MLGRKTKVYDANDYVSEFVYDELGRVIEQRVPFEENNGIVYYSVKKMWYDGNGNVIKEQVKSNASDDTDAYNETEYDYDAKNNLVMSKAFDGERYHYVQNYYDTKGNLLRVYTGLSSPLTINGLDDVTACDDNDYAVTKFSYDALGRLLSITDALNRVETNVYDNASGLLTSSTDRNGQTFNYEYNAIGGLTKKALSDNTNAITTVFGLTGQPVSKQNGTTTISYQYREPL